jgi:HEAT repeat protein
MKKLSLCLATIALGLLGLAAPLSAAEKTEDQLIKELDSPNPDIVASAMLKIEKQFPTSTKSFPKIKELLKDPRPKVHRKAARVLGALHADVSNDDLKAITTMLKASDSQEVMDALKALRGLKAESTVPEILPLLKSASPNVIRDACRALAGLGDKSTIPALEPLLAHKDPAVKKDAQDAIHQLKAK